VATMISFHVPNDRDLLATFGEVALRQEHLTHILRMTIKTLADLHPDEALDATAYDGSRQLRERIRKLARQRLGEGKPLLKLQALLERCRRATDRRNELIHGIWAKELDGEPVRRNTDHTWHPLPTVEDLRNLSNELQALTETLNTARLDGFLSEALSKRRGRAG
jgi:hypothetical protein